MNSGETNHLGAAAAAGHGAPDGLPELAAEDSQRELARRWLTRSAVLAPQHG